MCCKSVTYSRILQEEEEGCVANQLRIHGFFKDRVLHLLKVHPPSVAMVHTKVKHILFSGEWYTGN